MKKNEIDEKFIKGVAGLFNINISEDNGIYRIKDLTKKRDKFDLVFSDKNPVTGSEDGIFIITDKKDAKEKSHSFKWKKSSPISKKELINLVYDGLIRNYKGEFSIKYDDVFKEKITSKDFELETREGKNPIFYSIEEFIDMRQYDENREKNPGLNIYPYFYVDNHQNSSYDIIVYKTDSEIILLTNYSGFFPRMGHVSEVSDKLDINLPGKNSDNITRSLSKPRTITQGEKRTLLHYTNATEDMFYGSKYPINKEDVVTIKIKDVDKLEVRINNDVIFEVLQQYHFYKDNTPEYLYSGVESKVMSYLEIKDDGYDSYERDVYIYRNIMQTNEESLEYFANTLIELFPRAEVSFTDEEVEFKYSQLGICSKLRRKIESEPLLGGKRTRKVVNCYINGKKIDRFDTTKAMLNLL